MIKILLILLVSDLISEEWKPIHYKELLKHKDDVINYESIDDSAKNIDLDYRTSRNLSHRVIGYLPYWQYSYYPSLDYNLLTEINYFSAELNSQGDIVNTNNWENLDLVDFAHERGVKVKLCATLFGSAELTTLLNNSINRQNAINNLLSLVLLMNADGIDIDFELLPFSQRNNLVLFMQNLSNTFHEQMDDPIITMATPAVDWSDAWNYNALAQITDGLFIMGYDYSYSGSEFAGPVSPLGGYYYDLEYTVNDYINKTNGQLDKLILGLPYYGYDWPVINSSINSSTTEIATARVYAEAIDMAYDFGYIWHNESNTPWFTYIDNSQNWRQCWFDDSNSLTTKYQFAKESGLSGIGMWALGYDGNSEDLWNVLYDNFNMNINGDVNSDGLLNILDVVGIIDLVLNDLYIASADLNNDTIVSILDIIILVNLILSEFRN